jgi:hypothetical protein
MKKLILVLAMVAMLVAPAYAIEGDAIRLSYTFPMATVASATITSINIFTAPADMRLRAISVVTPTTTLIGNATDSVTFTIYADGVAIQSYNLASGLLTAATPKAFTLTAASAVISKDAVVKCAAVVKGDSKAVVTPVVNIHYSPTK